jgi:hypothetical protein
VGRRLIVADCHKNYFYFGARESPASVPGERKYTLLAMESGILGQCFIAVHPGNYGFQVRASWLARHPQ